jgi:hypothetical protein
MSVHASDKRWEPDAMDQNTVLSKSAKGKEEIDTRKYKLDQRLRSVLITVNGKLTVGELATQFAQMADINAVLDKLLREGFVQEPVADAGARLKQAQSELTALIAASLGPAGDDIAMKIEGTKTIEELRSYLESHRAGLDGALGKANAAAFGAKAAALTS